MWGLTIYLMRLADYIQGHFSFHSQVDDQNNALNYTICMLMAL